MDDWDPFRDFDHDPHDRYWNDGGDKNPRRPRPQARALWQVVRKHLPNVEYDTPFPGDLTAVDLVVFCDDDICLSCSQHASRILRRSNPAAVREYHYVNGQSVSAILRRKISAIETRNVLAWKKAELEGTRFLSDVEHKAREKLYGFGGVSLYEAGAWYIGPYPECVEKDKELWERKLQVLREALKQVGKGGRRANTYRDDAVRSAVRLWEELTGEFAVQPAYKAGTSERTNSMVEFVADVLDLYAEFGMKGSVSKNSGAFWTRILSDDS